MKKKRVLTIISTCIIYFLAYYIILPPINIQSREFWSFLVFLLVIGVFINGWTVISTLISQKSGRSEYIKGFKPPLIIGITFIGIILMGIYIIGTIFSLPILRAGDYRQLLTISNGDFALDIEEVNYSTIPILDKESASLLSERKMGSMIDMVSQYEISNYYSQINYMEKPYRVTPLEYGSFIKWIANRSTGIPAYIRIDMATQNVELTKLEEGIKISPSEYLSRDLYRYLRFRYPFHIFRSFNFEIDDKGVPYWICTVQENRIGLFGGVDIKGAVLLNCQTGENTYYDALDIPKWIDRVYDADLIVQQYDYYGTLNNGYLNSILSQKGCLQTTEGYNYIALDDDVWVYTGITSVTGDESIVGFILANQRTKETRYYQISGAKEYSAMASAEGQVQNLGYRATFPLLLNVGEQPTYFLALKDDAGLVKKYAMVNIEKYQIVAIGDTVFQCDKNYRDLIKASGLKTINNDELSQKNGTADIVRYVVEDGNTYIYMTLEGERDIYKIDVSKNVKAILIKEGNEVSIKYYSSYDLDFIEVFEIEVR